jgi:hypothetical protein
LEKVKKMLLQITNFGEIWCFCALVAIKHATKTPSAEAHSRQVKVLNS